MEWRCRACGKPHEENTPPCDNCGHYHFEKTTYRVTEGHGPEQLEWVCTECGRSHPRNSPPCSRCGNTKLERHELDYEDLDVGVDSYLDMASPGYLLAAAVAVALAVFLALGVMGVVDLPAVLGGQPTVSDVPGEAETAANLSLAAVEEEYVAAVNSRREATDRGVIDRNGALDDAATYLNQRYVKAEYADGQRPDLTRRDLDAFDVRCGGPLEFRLTTLATGADGRGDRLDTYSAARLADEIANSHPTDAPVLDANATSVGVDFHVAPDDTVYVSTLVCRS